jgi:hypothetical protein
MHYRSDDTKMAAMREAVRNDRPDLALGVLSGAVRAYIRSPSSKPGIQFHWNKPFPEGTGTIVYVDIYGPRGKAKPATFYVIPAESLARVVKKAAGLDNTGNLPHPRPVNPDSDHCYVPPEDVAEYLNGWAVVPPLGIAGYQQEGKGSLIAGDWDDFDPIPVDAFPPGTPGDTEDEDVLGSPTSWATLDNPFDPVPMNTGENEWHPGK